MTIAQRQIDWNATEAYFEEGTIAQIEMFIECSVRHLPALREMDRDTGGGQEGYLTDELSVARKILFIKTTSKARKINADLTPLEWDAIQVMRASN